MADDIGEPDNFDGDVNERQVNEALLCHNDHPSVLKIKEVFPSLQVFKFSETTSDMVLKHMKSLNVKKSCGYDEISPYFIKIAATGLAMPLSNLINYCFSNNVYPESFKLSETSPLYKAKDRFMKENYRPVSCPTVVSKVMEHQMSSQIAAHFKNIFHVKLSAFRNGISCEHVLINAVEDWKRALDQNKIVGSLFMDLSKAFDCLPHKLLISKLSAYGFSLDSCCLMASYLSGRKMRVKHYGFKSDWCQIIKGVPQGSVLGPTIYNIFVNDLLYDVGDYFYNYADDNSIAVIGDEIAQVFPKLKLNAEICTKWFSQNMMRANPDKFQFMVMSRKSNINLPKNITINNVTIDAVDDVKLLGVHIDAQFSFRKHVKNLCNKASRNLNVIKKMSNRVHGKAERIALVDAMVTSQFTYCPLVWHFCPKLLDNLISNIQKRCMRFVLNDYDYNSDFKDMLISCQKTTLFHLRLKKIALFMFRCFKELNLKYLNEMFEHKEIIYSLRDSKRVHLKKYNTVRYGYQSLCYAGAKLWNTLPVHVKNSENEKEFMNKLSSWKCLEPGCKKCAQFIYH